MGTWSLPKPEGYPQLQGTEMKPTEEREVPGGLENWGEKAFASLVMQARGRTWIW